MKILALIVLFLLSVGCASESKTLDPTITSIVFCSVEDGDKASDELLASVASSMVEMLRITDEIDRINHNGGLADDPDYTRLSSYGNLIMNETQNECLPPEYTVSATHFFTAGDALIDLATSLRENDREAAIKHSWNVEEYTNLGIISLPNEEGSVISERQQQ